MKLFILLMLSFIFIGCDENNTSLLPNNESNNLNNGGNPETTPVGTGDLKRKGDLQGTIPTLSSSEPSIQFGYDFYLNLCKRMVECRETAAVAELVSASRFGSTASCLESLVGRNHPQRWKEAIDANRLTFNAGAASSCLSALNSYSCAALDIIELLPSEISDCEAVIVGKGAVDGDCSSSLDCTGDLVCDDCPGACQAISKLECVPGELCDETQFCNVDTDKCEKLHVEGGICANDAECAVAFYCTNNLCVAREIVEAGKDCTGGSVICGMGYYCDGVCRAYKVLGQSCDNNACESPLYCDSTCKKAIETGSCTNGIECLSGECIGGVCASPVDLCKLKE